MSPDDDEPLPQLVALDEPRPLSPEERALLMALVEPLGVAELTEQARLAAVVYACSCGCPSVGLQSDGPLVPADIVSQLDDVGRSDVLSVTAEGTNDEGRQVDVTLHVVHGRVSELEIWTGMYGGPVETTLPDPTSLQPR